MSMLVAVSVASGGGDGGRGGGGGIEGVLEGWCCGTSRGVCFEGWRGVREAK
jgi:hypothetical protein